MRNQEGGAGGGRLSDVGYRGSRTAYGGDATPLEGWVDRLHRAGYRLAFRALRLWWRLRRPEKLSAAVALRHGGRLLVVRTSYHGWLDLPGGGVDPGEPPRLAAARELREETGIALDPETLAPAGVFRYRDHHRRVTTHVFACELPEPPTPRVDRREIVWADLAGPDELARAPLSPLLRVYLAGAEG